MQDIGLIPERQPKKAMQEALKKFLRSKSGTEGGPCSTGSRVLELLERLFNPAVATSSAAGSKPEKVDQKKSGASAGGSGKEVLTLPEFMAFLVVFAEESFVDQEANSFLESGVAVPLADPKMPGPL